MSLSKDEIISLASRYVEKEDMVDFAMPGEVFALFQKTDFDHQEKQDRKSWQFGGYFLCTGYEYDPQAKPEGKWIECHFIALISYPPQHSLFRLQPPHIVSGKFSSPDRTISFKMKKVQLDHPQNEAAEKSSELAQSRGETGEQKQNAKILTFPKKPRK